MASPSIAELAKAIAENTACVNDYLVSKGLPLPSFDVDAPSGSNIPADSPEVEAARVAVIDATLQLHDLMLGPRDYLLSFTHDELISMQAISRFKLANSFPTDSETTFGQIAQASGVDEPDLRRFLRHSMTKRIFCEPRKGVVVHTAASRLLAEDAQVADWVGASTDDLWQAAAQTINAMEKFPGSQEPHETGFAVANNSSKTSFEILADHPERARRFGSAMKAWTGGKAYDVEHLVRNHPWDSLGSGTVVDVGGSNGFVSIQLAASYPKLNFVVQDLAPTLVDADRAVPDAHKSRIQFMPHDFLNEQPVKNADVYLFRWIFHNWSDKYSVIMLRNLIPALKPGARIVVMDNVLPEPGVLPHRLEERVRSMDLTMKEMQNSREREMDEWAALFEAADARFKFLGGKKPEGSNLWILEAKWEHQAIE